jgi:hypothetical protein
MGGRCKISVRYLQPVEVVNGRGIAFVYVITSLKGRSNKKINYKLIYIKIINL